MDARAFALLLVALALGAIGQILMKYAIEQYKLAHGGEFSLFSALFHWGVILGLLCYVLSSLLYLQLLSALPISLLYPMVALNYVFVTVLGKLVLGEHVPVLRMVGLATIICGVVTVAMSYSATPPETEPPATETGVATP